VNFRPLIVVQDKVSMVAIKRTLQEGNQKVKKKVIPFYFIPLMPYVYNQFRRFDENESAPRNKANAIDARAPRGQPLDALFSPDGQG
jgi:hypothetical protein